MGEGVARRFEVAEAEAVPTSSEILAKLRAQRALEAAERAKTVRAVATVVGPFSLLAAAALTLTGWGPSLEHQALLGIGIIASLVAWLYGRVSYQVGFYTIAGGLTAWPLLEAATSDTLGDALVFVGLAGVPMVSLIADAIVKLVGTKGNAIANTIGFSWFAGWLLFWFNAPDAFRPVWCIAAFEGVMNGVETVVSIIISLVILAFMAMFGLARMLGTTPDKLFEDSSDTPAMLNQRTPPARSEWANSRRNFFDSVNLDG